MRKVLAVARFFVLAFELGCTDDPVAPEPEVAPVTEVGAGEATAPVCEMD